MKNTLFLGALLVCSGPLFASGIPCASCSNIFSATSDSFPKAVTLATPISANTLTPAAVALYEPESGCVYTGILSETVGGNKSKRVIDVDKKQCGKTIDQVDLTVPGIDAGKNYKEGISVNIYRSMFMTLAGPVMSPEMVKEILDSVNDATEQARTQNKNALPETRTVK